MATILLVEDDEQMRSMLKIVLERAGYAVQVAKNGKEALGIYSAHPSDLVITDIVMPDTDGLELIMDIQRSRSDVKIIAMTGGRMISVQDYLGMAKSLGAHHILAKPFSNQQMLQSIELALNA